MDKSMNMNALMEHCANLMLAKGYTNYCIQIHKKRWQEKILPYVLTTGSSDYSRAIGESYLQEKTKGLSRTCASGHIRSINILTEYLETRNISTRLKTAPNYLLEGEMGTIVREFLSYEEKELRLRDVTIINHTRCLSLFVDGLQIRGYHHFQDMVADDVLDFLNNSTAGKSYRLNALRDFLKYLYQKRLIEFDCLESITNYRIPNSQPLPSVYTEQEIAKIVVKAKELSASRRGKRDYAMLMLACRLGLRSSDIRYLTFSNIDWKNKVLTIKQYKTDVVLSLPLLHDVGDAIINYIKFGRPKSNLPYVFITETSPFRTLSATSISQNVLKIIRSTDINIGNRHAGSHTLRHSLATQLLKNGTRLPTISEVLGHTSTASTMLYIGVERETLLQYALDVPLIPNTLYTQKGGLFYV